MIEKSTVLSLIKYRMRQQELALERHKQAKKSKIHDYYIRLYSNKVAVLRDLYSDVNHMIEKKVK